MRMCLQLTIRLQFRSRLELRIHLQLRIRLMLLELRVENLRWKIVVDPAGQASHRNRTLSPNINWNSSRRITVQGAFLRTAYGIPSYPHAERDLAFMIIRVTSSVVMEWFN